MRFAIAIVVLGVLCSGAHATPRSPGLFSEFFSAGRAVRRAVNDVTVGPVVGAAREVRDVATAPLRDALGTVRAGANEVHEAVTGEPAPLTWAERRTMRRYGPQVVAAPLGVPVATLGVPAAVAGGPLAVAPQLPVLAQPQGVPTWRLGVRPALNSGL